MLLNSQDAEKIAVLNTAAAMCAAARTAPKACGIDHIDTAVVSGEDILRLADEMDVMSREYDNWRMHRDAENLRVCAAVVLIGTKESVRGLGGFCQLCHFADCGKMKKAGASCVYDPMDLGIAVGSACALAADSRVDNRVMFTAGKAAARLKMLGEDVTLIMGIPLSVSGKSPFFDREKEKD